MILQMLVDNETDHPVCRAAHGLSLWIEIGGRFILFDFGPKGVLRENAAALGVDLSKADLAVLSHGHADHGGGLGGFLEANPTVSIYVRPAAFLRHLSRRDDGIHDIGLDSGLAGHPRFVETADVHRIDSQLLLFATPSRVHPEPAGNATLMSDGPSGPYRDAFAHEQSLLISAEGMTVLVAGCAHAGILNILDRAAGLGFPRIDHVVGGFHLFSHGTGAVEPEAAIRSLAEDLRKAQAVFHTCHCTGTGPFAVLKSVLGDNIDYLKAGMAITL
ncbi:MAG: MBL fold metallo-hydrolase [Candidatus Izemoplasmatales bacterium]